MIYVLIAIVLLFVSFFVALVSLILEQRKMETLRQGSEDKVTRVNEVKDKAEIELDEGLREKSKQSKIDELQSKVRAEAEKNEAMPTTSWDAGEPVESGTTEEGEKELQEEAPLPWEEVEDQRQMQAVEPVEVEENLVHQQSQRQNGSMGVGRIVEHRSNKLQGRFKISKLRQ